MGEVNLYSLGSHGPHINCDSLNDDRIAALVFQNFRFQVTTPDGQAPFLVNTESADLRRRGVLVAEMPEVQDYSISIEPKKQPIFGSSADEYYTFEMSVGDRKVVVNNGTLIYYNNKTRVSSFRTGTSESFRFVTEKKRPDFASEPGINAPNSNVITIKVNRFRRERARVFVPPPMHYDSYRGFNDPFDAPVYRGFGNMSLSHNSKGSYGSERESSRGFGGSRAFGAAAAMSFGDGAADSVTLGATTGGSTVSGHRFVSDVSTTSTTDRFVPIDAFTVTIQLVHVEGTRHQAPLRPFINEFAARPSIRELRLQEQQNRQAEEQKKVLLQLSQAHVTPPQVSAVPMIPLEPAVPVTGAVSADTPADGIIPEHV
jgi:hypothetical protein